MYKYLQIIIAFCVLFGMGFGAMNHFATAEDVQMAAQRLDQKIKDDRLDRIRDRIKTIQSEMYALEDKYGNAKINTWNKRDRDRYRSLLADLELYKEQKSRLLKPSS